MAQSQKILQFRHEIDTWKRYLLFIQQENNHLKNRLSQALQKDTDHEFLERAEYFQSKFITEDDTVNMLRQDIHELDSLMIKEVKDESSGAKLLDKKSKKMQKDMDIVEKQFARLKSDFNHYLSEMV